ncbi:MAG TPA: nucleotide exchange factor GrpE [Tepidimicrobium sp.]|nr:nucleotide exchange factor GrpE [Tepidimicrobium sp.]
MEDREKVEGEETIEDEELVEEEESVEDEELNEEELLSRLEDELAEKEEELAKKEEEIKDLTDSLLRLRADFANYKRRIEKEKESTIAYALEGLMSDLLPILDNFERAMDSAEEKGGFYEGVNMIYEQLLEVLSNNGLQEIECVGKPFDPNLHHAVFTEESEEEEGTVLEAVQKGYLLKDKVIRPSMVKVAK